MYGFMKEMAATNCVATLLGLVGSLLVIVVFLDLEKTYELASASAILASMSAKEVQSRLLIWVADYLTDRETRVRFQGHLSHTTEWKMGPRRGGVFSPTLFNMLMENLSLFDLGEDARLLCYADDLALVVTWGGCLLRRAQWALNHLSQECGRLGLKISTAKTKTMSLKTRKQRPHPTLQGDTLPWVPIYQHLGIWIDTRLFFTPEVRYNCEATKTKLNLLEAMTRPPARCWAQGPPDVLYSSGAFDDGLCRCGSRFLPAHFVGQP
ncbi:uncharacterized protein LOC143038167 [Oratosquilla oratoria]|uniref:uncharacterized protein LOC143038167 n=1 Tax=Oratosquilla oratoria TaxID=337810 RepID=UPI003F7687F5